KAYSAAMALDWNADPYLLLLFDTRAPMLCAQAKAFTVQIDCVIQVPSHELLLTNARADAQRQPGAIPTVPRLLLIIAETQPATAVPCLSQAFTGPPSKETSLVKFVPEI